MAVLVDDYAPSMQNEIASRPRASSTRRSGSPAAITPSGTRSTTATSAWPAPTPALCSAPASGERWATRCRVPDHREPQLLPLRRRARTVHQLAAGRGGSQLWAPLSEGDALLRQRRHIEELPSA